MKSSFDFFKAAFQKAAFFTSYHHKGIGTEILTKLVEKCRSEEIKDIQLFCAESKKGFYRKHGFTERPDSAPGMELMKK